MNMLSFLGETPTIALRLAQDECGEEAIVIFITFALACLKMLFKIS